MFRNPFTIVAAVAWAGWVAALFLARNGDDVQNSYHSFGAVTAIIAIGCTAAAMFRPSR